MAKQKTKEVQKPTKKNIELELIQKSKNYYQSLKK